MQPTGGDLLHAYVGAQIDVGQRIAHLPGLVAENLPDRLDAQLAVRVVPPTLDSSGIGPCTRVMAAHGEPDGDEVRSEVDEGQRVAHVVGVIAVDLRVAEAQELPLRAPALDPTANIEHAEPRAAETSVQDLGLERALGHPPCAPLQGLHALEADYARPRGLHVNQSHAVGQP